MVVTDAQLSIGTGWFNYRLVSRVCCCLTPKVDDNVRVAEITQSYLPILLFTDNLLGGPFTKSLFSHEK